ncbi:transglycosylase SLT domain-containing protein [Ancylobacter terrae]|uniref:transglycosylase SLT domain-containing protein n=1 Tax=Ancylobacter sp. sgz301288 TaxID=3342077 RepID=UPI003859C839
MRHLRALAPITAALLFVTAAQIGPVAAETKPKPAPKTTQKPAPKPAAKPVAKKDAKKDSKAAAAAAPAKPAAPPAPRLTGALGNLQSAISLVEAGKSAEALDAADQLSDPGARALVRWLALRVTARGVGFDRAVRIINEHPTLPTPTVLRRRLEYLLYAENQDPQTIRAFFAQQRPISAEGKIALARALFATGDRTGGAAWLRDAWREDALSDEVESTVMVEFGGVLTRADHKYRADKRLYAEDATRGLRAAQRAGSDVEALARARIALFGKGSGDAAKLLAAVPASMRSDPAYYYVQAKVARRGGDDVAAARFLSNAPKTAEGLVDPNEWWVERRLVARELLDLGDAKTAYRVARDAVIPDDEHKRAEAQFTAGWIALRFLNDPRTALQHFATIPENQTHPATVSRGWYWQGRAYEAMGNTGNARAAYSQAARYTTAYYGQLARARIGVTDFRLASAPAAGPAQRAAFARDEGVQIFKLLQQIGKKDLAIALAADLGDRLDAAQLGLLSQTAADYRDARAMVVIGKQALGRGIPLESEAFPTIGIPSYTPIAEPVEPAIVYAIARQESMFNAAVVSRAGATGLMQVMPATGKTIANRTGASFDLRKLHADPSTNVQYGAAELRSLLDNYQNNYVLTFAAYNGGRGSVAKWIAAYGDPRDPSVDPIDWVERIPFSETRNYVQRVMENAQVYKARFNSRTALKIEADLRGTRGIQ